MPHEVTDVRSSPKDQIAFAATVLGKSRHCKKVFAAIYRGKMKTKAVSEIVEAAKLPRMRVLQEANKLANSRIINKTKKNGELAYEKDQFFTQNKDKIMRLAGNKAALEQYPTRTNPRYAVRETVIHVPSKAVDVKELTIDDIDSFSGVGKFKAVSPLRPIREKAFKNGLKHLIGEEGKFQDWGGESNDLFTTRVSVGGSRHAVAFGLKGRGTKGALTPRKMGRNGDQIQRLFRSPADVFIVQYWNQVDETVSEQMKQFASAKSALEGRRIYFGVIDGWDTSRLVQAYPDSFRGVYQ